MSRRNRQCGQTAVMFTLGLTLVFGTVGAVTDLGYIYYRKQAAQAAAQAAAGAAVKAAWHTSSGSFTCGANSVTCTTKYTCPSSITGNGSDDLQVGCLYAAQNGYSGSQVWFESGTGKVAGVNTSYYAVAHVNEQLPLLFSAVLGSRSALLSARSAVGYIPGTAGGCVYTLDPTDPGTLSISGSASLQTGCGVWVNTTNSAGINMNGGATLTASSGAVINVFTMPGYTGCSSGHPNCVSPAPTQSPTATDPLAGIPVPTDPGTCTSPTWNGKNGTISNPTGGVVDICGGLSLNNGTFTFPAGTYIFKSCGTSGNQGLAIQGSAKVTGTGVFFYFEGDCTTQITGGSSIDLTAPSSGTYNGILFWDANSLNATSPSMAGGAAQVLNGIAYFPKENLTYAGNSTATQYLSLIAYQISVTGSSSITNPGKSPYLSAFTGFAVIE